MTPSDGYWRVTSNSKSDCRIDAPEYGQAFGQRSKQSLSELVFNKRIDAKRTLCAVLLGYPILLMSAVYDPIHEQIKPNTLTFIGESHKQTESVELFQTLVLAAVKDHHCPVIGLEIASDQQTTLDAVMLGKSSVKQIKLWPSLDHAAYRRMIENFAGFKRNDQCIRVIAIDVGMDNAVDCEQWMLRD